MWGIPFNNIMFNGFSFFFYKVIFVISGAVFLVFDAMDLMKCEFKHKNKSVQSESIIVDLNHQLKNNQFLTQS